MAKVLSGLDEKLEGKVRIGSARFSPFNALILKDVLILDDNPVRKDEEGWVPVDTLFSADLVTATLSLGNFLPGEGLHIGRIDIDGAMLHLVTEIGVSAYPNNMARIFGMPKPPEVPVEKGKVFDASKVRVRNFRFRLSDASHPHQPCDGTHIDWQDLDLVASLEGHNLRMAGSRVSGVADRLVAREKCGYEIIRATGRAKVGMGKTEVSHFRLIDEWSDLRLKSYTMNYANAYAFRDFIKNVPLGPKIGKGSVLSMKSLYAYTGFPKGLSTTLFLDGGEACGYVNDMRVDKLQFTDADSGVRGSVSASATGIPDIETMLASAKVQGLTFTTSSLERLLAAWAPGVKADLKGFAPGRTFVLDADGNGPLNKLKMNARLSSRIGKASARAEVRNLLSAKEPLKVSGTVSSDDLQIGTLTGKEFLGGLTMHGGLKATFADDGPSVIVDSLRISKLGAFGYDYSNIAAAGRFSGSAFDGKLICDDPNLNFIFQGIFNLSGKTSNALYKFYANLGYSDLVALNLYKGETARVSGQVFANFMRIGRGDLIGDIDVQGFTLENEEGLKDIGDISIASHSNDDVHRIQFNSSFADGGYVGSRPVSELLEDIQAVTTRRDLPALYKATDKPSSHGTSELEFNFHDSWDLLSYFIPGLYVADSTSLRMQIDKRGILKGRMTSPRIAFGANYLKGLDLELDNLDRSLNCIVTGKEMRVAGLGFRDAALTAYAEDNNFALGLHYDNAGTESDFGEIYLTGDFSRDETDTLIIKARPLYSYIKLNGDQWDIGESEIRLRAGELDMDRFLLTNGGQSIAMEGGLSPRKADTLKVTMDNFDLSTVDNFLVRPLDLAGSADGICRILSPTGRNSGIEAEITGQNLSVAGNEIGSISLSADWDEITEQYRLELANNNAGRQALTASGFFSPTERTIDATANLSHFSLAVAQPFLSEIFNETGGRVSGSFTAQGPLDSLILGSNGGQLEEVFITVGPTGASYTLDGPFFLDENGLYLDNVSISDERDGQGSINGSLDFNSDSPVLDADIEFDNMTILDLDEEDGSAFYGSLYASGNIKATGALEELQLDVDAVTSDDGQVHVPLNGYSVSSSGNLLTFRQEEKEVYIDPYEARMGRSSGKTRKTSDLTVRARINATEDLTALLEIDKSTGNVMSVRGSGLVNLEFRPAYDIFTVNGDYSITEGHYNFVALGLANREFSIKEGSSIKFNGELPDSDLDVEAVYTLKTQLSTLLSDTTSVTTRRTVECGIKIDDKIVNPQLSFSINIPDLDPTTKSLVESALNTEDKIQRQFVALLVTGTFLPNEASGIVNNTDILYSNVTEIMSNQLNNILQKLDIPLDLGLGYHPNDRGTDIFDVAVSTQLFNNRVLVNGTIGNRQYSTTTNPNGDMVGDLDIEVKLDKPGKFRLNLFSHSADEYTSYLDYSQRNGVGLSYQKEFNKFSDFIKGIFRRKEKDAEIQEEEMKTIKIEEEYE